MSISTEVLFLDGDGVEHVADLGPGQDTSFADYSRGFCIPYRVLLSSDGDETSVFAASQANHDPALLDSINDVHTRHNLVRLLLPGEFYEITNYEKAGHMGRLIIYNCRKQYLGDDVRQGDVEH